MSNTCACPLRIRTRLKVERVNSLQPRTVLPQINSYSRSRTVSFARQHSHLRTGDVSSDHRVRLSQLWAPSGGIAASSGEDSHSKLVRAGFLRQAHSGIFHMLPLGRRVQDKLEILIDKYMAKLNASKLCLSSISSAELWARSGRLKSAGSELFHFKDRREVRYLLSPTHEEEITSLVGSVVKSYKELPIRLYQTSRKYRDELRPRHGLLRSREFLMKDLYTFDCDAALAMDTYHQVRRVYASLFDELKISYLVAEADSGDMGGSLSHEFHFPTLKGEDRVISCNNCSYVANEELAESIISPDVQAPSEDPQLHGQLGNSNVVVWRGISRDRLTLCNVWYMSLTSQRIVGPLGISEEPEINIHAIKALMPGLDTSVEDPLPFWKNTLTTTPPLPGTDLSQRRLPQVLNLVDSRLPRSFRAAITSKRSGFPLWPPSLIDSPPLVEASAVFVDPSTGQPLNLLRIRDGDKCPRCSSGLLKMQKAIELGHTFYLGTRYSDPLNAVVTLPVQHLEKGVNEGTDINSSRVVAMHMGCYGIGVTRMIGAVAETLADERGLNWPRIMAPFEAIIVPTKGLDIAALEVYDSLCDKTGRHKLDLILDDRPATFPWKMRDADLVGYPVVIVVGRGWETRRVCEVQCRRLKVYEEQPFERLQEFVEELLRQL